MTRTDDFASSIKLKLAKRVNFKCSNPRCKRPTSGPTLDNTDGVVNIGVAAHITAASLEGPRYDSSIPSAVRSSIENAIWCCQVCAKLIDDDPAAFPTTVLNSWKQSAESASRNNLEIGHLETSPALDPEEVAAQHDILVGALEGHEGNMIVYGERNGWDVVTIIGENYNASQYERALYVEAMTQLIDAGLAQRRGGGIAYLLTFKGLKKANQLKATGTTRRKPGHAKH